MARRLVADGEHGVDQPAKLCAPARVFSTGHGRRTDATDGHPVAVVDRWSELALRPVKNWPF